MARDRDTEWRITERVIGVGIMKEEGLEKRIEKRKSSMVEARGGTGTWISWK